MALRYAKAENIKYSIADEEQFKYLITRLGSDEQKAFEEIGERIRNSADKKITKREIQEVFQKHAESTYRSDTDSLNHRLTKILKHLVDDGGLKAEVEKRKPPASKIWQGRMGGKGGEFFGHMMGEAYFGKINDNWGIVIPVGIAHSIGLEGGMSLKFGWEGDSLALTLIKETEMPVKIRFSTTSQQKILEGRASLIVGIPVNMLLAGGLKVGDYASWTEEGSLFRLTKAEKDAPYARKIQWVSTGTNAGISIPKEIAEKAHIEPGQYGFWTFDDLNKSLWMEVGNRCDVAKITKIEREYGARFCVIIPGSMRGKFEKGEEVVIERKDGEIYVKKG